ncbi:YhbD family protein [Sporolactobacillus kofuensis]|uniref:YhbD family protein n=1 Tax=Sporolactobacillus kofuensis TaxID=269672 RepID=A0ABW1WBV0_9BACL|nr:YhbD family protein [Sporolactobacillus kofuensis]
MEEELIAKKDLLEMTGISYGQLYRWKRKQLIPEDWFIRKSTFTGQETFFPKEKMLKRVQMISELKDTLSLDELAERVSPQSVNKIVLSEQELISRNIVSQTTLRVYRAIDPSLKTFPFDDVLALFLLERLLKNGQITIEEAKELLNTLKTYSHKVYDKSSSLYFVRKMGVPMFLLVAQEVAVYFDDGVNVIEKIQLPSCIEALKATIGENNQTNS